jgi:putative phage-type endonuclease
MIEQRTEAWFEARTRRVTGSVAGALLGVSPFVSQKAAVETLRNPPSREEREAKDNHIFAYGREVEPHAVAMFEMETGLTVTDAPFVPFEDWLGASPDGYVHDNNGQSVGLLEVKCPWSLRNDPAPRFKSIEELPHYYAQVQIELHCCDMKRAYFYQYANGRSKLEIVEINHSYLGEVLFKLRKIWESVFTESPEKEIAERLLSEYRANKEAIELATERNKVLLEQMLEMAGHTPGPFGSAHLTKVERKGSIPYAKVLKEHLPDIDLEPYRGDPSTSWQVKC